MRRNANEYIRERSFLVRSLREVEEDYDYILIDCPPNLYLMTQNALVASEKFIVPAIPDHLSTIGLNILLRKVENIGEVVSAAATIAGTEQADLGVADLAGIVFVRVRLGGTMLTNAHASKMEELRGAFPNGCFETYTTELIGYTEAAAAAVPVWGLRSTNAIRAAEKAEYDSIAKEFVRRV
jgi:chromosome partitioning protein